MGFTVLVVIKRDLIDEVGRRREMFGSEFLDTYDRASLYMGTYWLMIPIMTPEVVNDIKAVLRMKLNTVSPLSPGKAILNSADVCKDA